MIGWIKGKLLLVLGLLSAAGAIFGLWERSQLEEQKAARAGDREKAERAQARQLVNANQALAESEKVGEKHVDEVEDEAASGDFGSLGDQ